MKILNTLIEAASDCNTEYQGAEETKFVTTHRFTSKTKSSCVKTISTFETILMSRRVGGVALFIDGNDIVLTQVKKLTVAIYHIAFLKSIS